MRFFGKVGFGDSVETPPDSGIWKDVITERGYYGDVVRNQRSLETADGVIPDVFVNNSISIVADGHAMTNFHKMRYVEWDEVRWTVANVTVQQPRLILSLGSVYNGPTP